ncbi:MAG: hypothetical protein IPM46_03145 [Flavobacteriales bacterium]|nr:hypothetical protein [Flavobacteriales bacterium]
MQSDYHLLLSKLDAFIRKYYKDLLIRGALYAVGLLIVVFLAAALLEHLGHFGIGMRTALFWSCLAAMVFIIVRFLLLPAFRLMRLGRTISHEEAARVIGAHFGDVQDRLLNTLQLRQLAQTDPGHRDLIEAAIAQRSKELSHIPFVNAIDLRRNKRYLRYALPPLGLLLLVLLAAPSVLTGPTQRILMHRSEFVPDAPFRFMVLNDPLEVPEEQDFELMVELSGDVIPQQMSLDVDGGQIPLVKVGPARFSHRFRNVREAIAFRLAAEGFHSTEYVLRTVPNPLVLGLSVTLDYPPYLGMAQATEQHAAGLVVPAGTRITWEVSARSADRMTLAFDDTALVAGVEQIDGAGSRFRFNRRLLQGHHYQLVPEKDGQKGSDPMQHVVEVVPDLYPTIQVESQSDSSALRRVFFNGEIGDDHGIRRLLFHYRFVSGGDSVPEERRSGSQSLPVDALGARQQFYHGWDLYDLSLLPGDRIEHWFEVWDNDGVNGSKSTRSAAQVFAAPSLKELAEKQAAQSETTKSEMRDHIREAQDLQRELERLRRELLDKKEAGWQEKQRMQNILDRQKKLEERIEKANEQLRRNQQEQREFSPMDERLLEKQERVQELFENVLSEEMKELYRKMEEMLDKIDKEQLQEQLREMKLGQEDIEKELDRALEMFKRMEVEQKVEDITKQLEDLAKRQEELSEESKRSQDSETLSREQEALNKEFQELREQMDALEKKNEELEEPMNLPDTEPMEQEVEREQQQGSEQLQKKQNQKAAGSQKSAADKMEQLAFQMKSAMESNAQEQQEEDMDALRQLLENIIQLSFDQESLMTELVATSVRDPRIVQHGRAQRKLRDDAKVIEDSLFALSKRVPQLQSIVNREMNAVNGNMDESTRLLGEARANERFKPMAADKQQHAMTSLNNLALLLDEALQQMMQQMNAQSKSGNCSKPGSKPGSKSGDKPGMARMKAQQEALQKQLEQMRKAMEEGRSKGEKPGQRNPGGMGLPSMSQQLAQMAAQQAAIRKEMQRLAQELNKDGSGAGNEVNRLAQQMEQQEKDIVNRNISPETMRRQQEIMTRLLEHDKAEQERELDQKRMSNEGRERPAMDPQRAFEQHRRKAREAELLRTLPPGLKPYYRNRVSSYFGTFDRP